jgi:4'-phosphopantetheinyl transferase
MSSYDIEFNRILKPKDVPYLKDGEVHIWHACFSDNVKYIQRFASFLSKDEHQKAENYKFFKDGQDFIISRGILRSLLSYYLKEIPENIEIIYGLWGKPYVLTKQPLYFNLSHSRNSILCAIAKNYEIGIDIEYVDSTLDLEGIALNILSPKELAYWKNVKPEAKADTFFKLWVSKEAFLKASGKGWLDNYQQIPSLEGISLAGKDSIHYKSSEKMEIPYFFKTIHGYESALFIKGPFLQPIHYKWDFKSLEFL